jgi:hypothetical protein
MQFDFSVRLSVDAHERCDRRGRLRCPRLPGLEEPGCARLRQRPGDAEHLDLADRVDCEAEFGDCTKTSAAAAAHGPEQVRLVLRVGFDDCAMRIDQLEPLQAVASEPVWPPDQAKPAAERMSGDTDGWAASARKSKSSSPNRLVDRRKRCARANRHRARATIEFDVVHQASVDDDPCTLRKAFVAVPAAAQRKWQAIGARPLDHDGHSFRGLAKGAQLRAQQHAFVAGWLVGFVAGIAGPQQQCIARRQIRRVR